MILFANKVRSSKKNMSEIFSKPLTNEEAVPVIDGDFFSDSPESRFALAVFDGRDVVANDPSRLIRAYLRLRANVYIGQIRVLDVDQRRSNGTEVDEDDERSTHFALLENRVGRVAVFGFDEQSGRGNRGGAGRGCRNIADEEEGDGAGDSEGCVLERAEDGCKHQDQYNFFSRKGEEDVHVGPHSYRAGAGKSPVPDYVLKACKRRSLFVVVRIGTRILLWRGTRSSSKGRRGESKNFLLGA